MHDLNIFLQSYSAPGNKFEIKKYIYDTCCTYEEAKENLHFPLIIAIEHTTFVVSLYLYMYYFIGIC